MGLVRLEVKSSNETIKAEGGGQPVLRDDWWPKLLEHIPREEPMQAQSVTVAEYVQHDSVVRLLVTALASEDLLSDLLAQPEGLGYRVEATGPHPSHAAGEQYTPRFWVWAGKAAPDGLEPLVVQWSVLNDVFIWPDQGLLMTYGLRPRFVKVGESETVHWDDPSLPRKDVVIASLPRAATAAGRKDARVEIDREYLEDYSAIRGHALVQGFYEKRAGDLTSEEQALLQGESQAEFRLPGRLIVLHYDPTREQRGMAQVWGSRLLTKPGTAVISAGRSEYGMLDWPGLGPIGDDEAKRLRPMDEVYVSDEVLGRYEGRPEFSVHPDTGAVFYSGQWSVARTRRVGRDRIAVEIKTLYEGAPPAVVAHWHKFAVQPPQVETTTYNVASRAHDVLFALVSLGESIAQVAESHGGYEAGSKDYIGLKRSELQVTGWWTSDAVEPCTRHISLTMSQDLFLGRCNELGKLIIDGLEESNLRKLLEGLGAVPSEMKEFRSLKLLERLTELAATAAFSGLDLASQEVHERRSQKRPNVPSMKALYVLRDLRNLADHRAGASSQRTLRGALVFLDISTGAVEGGWGIALDALYDKLEDALARLAALLTAT